MAAPSISLPTAAGLWGAPAGQPAAPTLGKPSGGGESSSEGQLSEPGPGPAPRASGTGGNSLCQAARSPQQ
eukprot:5817113-Alexandrium_andersonii.AAC.1